MDELSALARFREPESGPDPAALARARHRLLEEAAGRPRPAPRPAPRPWARPGPRRLVAAVAATTLAIVGLAAAEMVTVGERPVGATAEAADLLRQAADRTIGASDPTVGPDEYLHITTVAVYLGMVVTSETEFSAWLTTYTDELFAPGDPANEWVLRRSDRTPYRPEDAAVAEAVAESVDRKLGEVSSVLDQGFTERIPGDAWGESVAGSWGTPTPEFLAELPRDPRRLLDRIYADTDDGGSAVDHRAFMALGDLLRSGLVPADLRAALFQAAALIPGVEVTDRAANLAGRTGIAVGRYSYDLDNHTREEIIFDPETGAVIGEREILLDRSYGPHLPAGDPIAWTAVTVEVVPKAEVDQIPAEPRALGAAPTQPPAGR